MIGASTSIGAVGAVYPPVQHNSPHLSDGANHSLQLRANSDESGALTVVRRVVSQALGSTGFVDLRASFHDSFVQGLQYRLDDTGIEDLKPGVLRDLMSWAISRIAMGSSQALEVQARVAPEAAFKLLV